MGPDKWTFQFGEESGLSRPRQADRIAGDRVTPRSLRRSGPSSTVAAVLWTPPERSRKPGYGPLVLEEAPDRVHLWGMPVRGCPNPDVVAVLDVENNMNCAAQVFWRIQFHGSGDPAGWRG